MPGFGGSKPVATNVAPPKPLMPGLNSLFQTLFGGKDGAGATAITSLTDAAAGKGAGASTVTPDMIQAIRDSSANTQKLGFGQIQNKFAASGMAMSSDMMESLANYNVNFGAQTEKTIADLKFQGAESAAQRQLGASSILEETFSNAAMAFAPTQVVGVQGGSNVGGAALGAGSSIISAMIMAGMFA